MVFRVTVILSMLVICVFGAFSLASSARNAQRIDTAPLAVVQGGVGVDPADTCEEFCSHTYSVECPSWTCPEGQTLDQTCYDTACDALKVALAICRVDACVLCAAEADRHAAAVAAIRKKYHDCVTGCANKPPAQQTACLNACNAQLDADLAAEHALEDAAFAAIVSSYQTCEGQALATFYTACQACCH